MHSAASDKDCKYHKQITNKSVRLLLREGQMPVYLNCLAESSNKDRAKATNDREKNVRDISTTHSRQTVMKKQKETFPGTHKRIHRKGTGNR